jgi:hypothetical protein
MTAEHTTPNEGQEGIEPDHPGVNVRDLESGRIDEERLLSDATISELTWALHELQDRSRHVLGEIEYALLNDESVPTGYIEELSRIGSAHRALFMELARRGL